MLYQLSYASKKHDPDRRDNDQSYHNGNQRATQVVLSTRTQYSEGYYLAASDTRSAAERRDCALPVWRFSYRPRAHNGSILERSRLGFDLGPLRATNVAIRDRICTAQLRSGY